VISLPMASDTLRQEARVIRDAADRAAEQMGFCLEATLDAQARIRKIEDLLDQVVDWYTPPNDNQLFPIQLVRDALNLCTPRY